MNVWGKKICISHSRESISWDLFGYGWQHQHSHGGRLAEELTEKICLSLEQSGPPPSPQKTWPKKTECNWKPDSTRPGGFLFFLFLDLCFAMMMSPEVGIAHREKVSQEFLVKWLLGRIDSPSSFFFVPQWFPSFFPVLDLLHVVVILTDSLFLSWSLPDVSLTQFSGLQNWFQESPFVYWVDL